MRNFQLYIVDSRSRVPQLIFATLKDDGRARELAERLMAETPHGQGVEVCENGLRLFGIGSCARDSLVRRAGGRAERSYKASHV